MKTAKHIQDYIKQVHDTIITYEDGLIDESEMILTLHDLSESKAEELIDRYKKRKEDLIMSIKALETVTE